jgi:hypothetical protein
VASLPALLVAVPQWLQQRAQIVGDRKRSACPVLRRLRVKSDLARLEVDLSPLKRQDLARDPPTGDVRERDDWLERRRQVSEDTLQSVELERPCAGVAFFE